MQIFQETISLTNINIYPFVHPESVCFFDIETTGLSPDVSSLYLIGALTLTEDAAHLTQWFANDYDSEAALLAAFFDFIKAYRLLVHFNGDNFDIPYLRKKAAHYGMDFTPDSLSSMDIYRQFRPYKKLFSLRSIRQKALEEFIGIRRTDCYDGGQLIQMYSDFMQKTFTEGAEPEDLRRVLLLHNRDDIACMLPVSSLCIYPDIFSGTLSTEGLSVHCGEDTLCFELPLPVRAPAALSLCQPFLALSLKESLLSLTVSYFRGELKHFFKNYKDYYYLPEEDTAIHKSLAAYVDAGFKEKAKASNCYIRREDIYLPFCPDETADTFDFSAKEHHAFFLRNEAKTEDSAWCSDYFRHLLRQMWDGHR